MCVYRAAFSHGQLVGLPAFSCRWGSDPVVATAGARPVARQRLAAKLPHEHVHVLGDDVLDDEQAAAVARDAREGAQRRARVAAPALGRGHLDVGERDAGYGHTRRRHARRLEATQRQVRVPAGAEASGWARGARREARGSGRRAACGGVRRVAACGVRRVACGVRRVACSVRRAACMACGVRRAARGARRAACGVCGEQRAESRERARKGRGVRRAENGERRAESAERRVESGEQRAESGEQSATCGERRAACGAPRARSRVQSAKSSA